MTTAEFKTSVEAVVNQYGFTGSLIPAAWFDAKREDERYGLLYDGGNLDWNVEQIANTLHAVAHQGKMLVVANRDGLGEEFAAGKQCLVTVEGEGMQSLLYRVHNALRKHKGETNNFELVAYEKMETLICGQPVNRVKTMTPGRSIWGSSCGLKG